MFIDPVEVAILAVAATLGAVGAAFVWWAVTTSFRIRRKARVTFVFLLLGSVFGITFLFESLLPWLAPPLVRVLPDPVYYEPGYDEDY